MSTARAFIPRPRRQGVVSQELDGETLLYVEETHQASSLNASASRLWALCDGGRPVEAIAAEANLPSDVVMTALKQFASAGLLENGADLPSVNHSRRRILGQIGFAGPVILMVMAPLARAAASCAEGPTCMGAQTCCSSGQTCQSGLCPP